MDFLIALGWSAGLALMVGLAGCLVILAAALLAAALPPWPDGRGRRKRAARQRR